MGGDEGSKLEMRCSADEAWYDGTLRFATDSNDVIVVHFNNFGEEEDETFPTSCLLDPRKLKSRVRVRSQQLQDFQCKLVNEGQNICGCLEDRGDRKYYDAKVVSILKKKHSFSDDSEECNCDFRLIWLDGPKKGKATSVGCAEVCFLSNDAPEDDPMVKNLVKRLTGNGELRPKLTPKALPSPRPRPRTPSLSLEIAASKKQASAEPSPPSLEHASLKKLASSKDHLSSTLPNHRVQLGKQGNAKSVGSKKKRIMQAEVMEHPDLASDNDVLNNFDLNARPSSTPKDRSREGSEDARGHGNVSDDSEQRGGGGESTKKGFVICEKRRLVKVKAPKVVVAPAPEVIREKKVVVRTNSKSISIGEPVKLGTEKVAVDGSAVRDKAAAVREEDDILRRVKEPVKSNTKKMATTDINAARDEAAVAKEDDDVIRPPVKWRAKFNTSGKKATPDAACEEAAAVREDGILHSSFKEQENSNTKKTATPDVEAISLTLGERVKLKSLEKSKSVEASPQKKKPKVSPQKKKAAAHKVSLLKVGMQIAGGKMQKNLKQVQLVSRLSSKPDEATRPGTTSRPNDVAATEPKEQQQKRKPGRPRKHHLPEPVTQSLASKKQPIQGFTKEQRQNTQQEEIIDAATTEKLTSDPATKKTAKKKRPREEPSAAMADTEDIASDKSAQEEDETLDEAQHVTKHPRGNKDIKTIGQSGREKQQPQNDDTLSDKSADNDEEHTSLVKSTKQPRQFPQNECENSARAHANDDAEDLTSPATNTERSEKKSIADGYYDIVMKYDANRQQLRESSVEKTSEAHEAMTPGSSEELIGSPPRDSNLFQQDTRVSELRVIGSPPRDSNLFQQDTRVSELRATGTPRESNASGKRRRRHVVVSDDEDDEVDEVDAAAAAAAAKKVKSGSLDSSATSQDVRNDAKTTSNSALDEEGVVQKQGASRLLLISNMEMDVSAHDAMQVLQELTEGVCAVHVLPVGEFQSSTAGYGLYRDSGCALKALQLLARGDCFIVSPKGRPWIISQSKQIYGSHLYGFAAHTAFQSDDSGVCGIISDQPPVQKLVVVTKQSNINAYSQALERSKIYEEHRSGARSSTTGLFKMK